MIENHEKKTKDLEQEIEMTVKESFEENKVLSRIFLSIDNLFN